MWQFYNIFSLMWIVSDFNDIQRRKPISYTYIYFERGKSASIKFVSNFHEKNSVVPEWT